MEYSQNPNSLQPHGPQENHHSMLSHFWIFLHKNPELYSKKLRVRQFCSKYGSSHSFLTEFQAVQGPRAPQKKRSHNSGLWNQLSPYHVPATKPPLCHACLLPFLQVVADFDHVKVCCPMLSLCDWPISCILDTTRHNKKYTDLSSISPSLGQLNPPRSSQKSSSSMAS